MSERSIRDSARPIETAIGRFWADPGRLSFNAVFNRPWYEVTLSADLSARLDEAVWYAVESAEWRLRAAGIDELCNLTGSLTRKADAIVSGLLAKQESVRCASWGAIDGVRLSRIVLSRLESMEPSKLLIFEVLMAVDQMAEKLADQAWRDRLIALVRKIEGRRSRSGTVRWKIGETLYSHLHFDLDPDEGSVDAAYWSRYRARARQRQSG
jgi:hypothetical protein